MEEMSYVFSFTFISPRSFSPCIGGRQHCHVVLPTKKCLLCFYLSLQISVALFLFEFRWPAAFSLFLCLSLAPYFKFADMTINRSLKFQKIRIQKQFPLSGFVFIDSLAAPALQDASGYSISRQNNLELPSFSRIFSSKERERETSGYEAGFYDKFYHQRKSIESCQLFAERIGSEIDTSEVITLSFHLSYYSGTSILRGAKGLAKFLCYNEVL